MAFRRSLPLWFIALLWANPAAAEAAPPRLADKTPPPGVLPLEDLRVFTKAYEHIRSLYITEIDDKTLLEYAIRGMLEQLDPHSAYLDVSSFEDLQINTMGEFGGLGIEVGMEDGFVKVISPIDDTPAAKAGIEAGDLIVKIGDTAIKGLSLGEAVQQMRGPKGSKVVLTIIRRGVEQPIELTLVRDIIKVNSVRTEVIDDHFAYLRVAQFQVNTGRDLIKSFKELQKKHSLKGIVLDLRNNPGGLLQASVEVADAFLDGGLVVYTDGRMPQSDFEYRAESGDIGQDLPMVILINEGSASASEIVAGALQDHGRAVVMGTQSFGKGSVQTVIPITEDKALKLTTALYYTPNGRSIQAEGIVPDIIAERVKITALESQASMREAQLAGHLDNVQRGAATTVDRAIEKQTEPSDSKPRPQEEDSQLMQALNLLKGLAILQQKPGKDADGKPENQAPSRPTND